VLQAALVGNDRGEGEEDQIATGHEGVGQPVRPLAERQIRCKRAFAHPAEHVERDHPVGPQPCGPGRRQRRDPAADRLAQLHLDAMALAVFEADGLDALETIERPGETGRRILPGRQKHQR